MTRPRSPLSAGGFASGLSEKAKQEIHRRFPAIPVDRVDYEAAFYNLKKDSRESAPHQMRGELTRLLARVDALLETAAPMEGGRLAQLIGKVSNSPGNALADLTINLNKLKREIPRAIAAIPKGAHQQPNEYLVENLVPIVEAAGLPVDCKPNGPVCMIAGIVFGDLGAPTSDVRKIVERVIKPGK